jgi:hypothetical protein
VCERFGVNARPASCRGALGTRPAGHGAGQCRSVPPLAIARGAFRCRATAPGRPATRGAQCGIPSTWRSPITPRSEGNMRAKLDDLQASGEAGPAPSHDDRFALRPRRDSPCGGRRDATPPPAHHPGPRACPPSASRRPARPARTCSCLWLGVCAPPGATCLQPPQRCAGRDQPFLRTTSQ